MNNIFHFYNSILELYISAKSIKQLEFFWNEKTRFYHNISHLKQIIWDIQHNIQYRELSILKKHALLLSSFFHDSIYNPMKNNNEDESIKFFKFSYIGHDEKMVQIVCKMIRSTQFRTVPRESLIKIFWEADNAGFLGSFKSFLEIEKKIRAEFIFVSLPIYKKNRIKFLKLCLGTMGSKADNNINKLIEHIQNIYYK